MSRAEHTEHLEAERSGCADRGCRTAPLLLAWNPLEPRTARARRYP